MKTAFIIFLLEFCRLSMRYLFISVFRVIRFLYDRLHFIVYANAWKDHVFDPVRYRTIFVVSLFYIFCIWYNNCTSDARPRLDISTGVDPDGIANIIVILRYCSTARRYASAVYAVVVCLSVRLSRRHCTKTAKCRITQTKGLNLR